jgi:mannose-6-phosphate isomerase-like protein (cupin superfamily)
VIVHDLSPDAVSKMVPVDLARATEEPPSPIGNFDFHGCVCGVGSFVGRPPWELHPAGDELLHILAGECQLTIREERGEITRTIRTGDLVIVPQGCWHSNDAGWRDDAVHNPTRGQQTFVARPTRVGGLRISDHAITAATRATSSSS